MSSLLAIVPSAVIASALAMAYPVPLGQPVEPATLSNSNPEIITIEEDRVQRMTVPVSIEGRGPYSFVIDTGAERTVLSKKIAANLALEAEEPAQLVSIAGNSMVDMVYVPSLTLGKRSYEGLVSPVLLEHNIGAEGMIGLDGLQEQRILFDFVANQIIIEDADKKRSADSAREIVVRARRRSGQLIFTDATVSGIRVNVVVDTGAQVSIANPVLRKHLLEKSKELADGNLLIAVTGQTLGIEYGRARDFRIGRAKFSNLPMAFADAPLFKRLDLDRKPSLLLGMDVLRKFDRVAIDFARRKIHFMVPKNARKHPKKWMPSRIKS